MDLNFMMDRDMLQFVHDGWGTAMVLTPEGERYVESQTLTDEDERNIEIFLHKVEKDLDLFQQR